MCIRIHIQVCTFFPTHATKRHKVRLCNQASRIIVPTPRPELLSLSTWDLAWASHAKLLSHLSHASWIFDIFLDLRAPPSASSSFGHSRSASSWSVELYWVCWCVLCWHARGVKLLRSQTAKVNISEELSCPKVSKGCFFSAVPAAYEIQTELRHPASLKVHLESIDWAGVALITLRMCQNMIYMFIINFLKKQLDLSSS